MAQILEYPMARPAGPEKPAPHPVQVGSLVLGWLLAATAFTLALLAVIYAPVSAPIAPALVLLLVVTAIYVKGSIRRRRSVLVLSYLEQATRLNLPLTRMLAAAERSEEPAVAIRLGAMRQCLEGGGEVAQALGYVPEVPGRVVGMVAAGERLGCLPAVLRRLLERDRRRPRRDTVDLTFVIFYPLSMIIAISTIVSLLAIFVVPKFRAIFGHMHVKVPEVSEWVFDGVGSAAGPVAVVAGLVLLAYLVRESMYVMGIGRLTWVGRCVDRIIWWTPVAGRIARDRGLADLFQVMGEALVAGYPVDRALAQSGEMRVNAVLGRRVDLWLAGMGSGLGVADAAKAAGMPKLAVGMLSTAQASGDMAEVCKFLSSYYGGRLSRTVVFVQASVAPVMAVLFGIIVALVALSVFVPMVRLAGQLMPVPGVL